MDGSFFFPPKKMGVGTERYMRKKKRAWQEKTKTK